ncbi:MAG: (d)CMP kinase [Rhabdochlamydiaceae bacterium]|nr:(d)CMP kinase [Rhabdochlamydiaceae bacterium]
MIVTIDGPSGTGKSTVARLLAQRLGFSFFDTGAMYRALAWWILQERFDIYNVADLQKHLPRFSFLITENLGEKKYWVDEVDVTEAIRTKEVTEAVSKISAIGEIRQLLLPLQRTYGKNHNVVFEGRDLGTVVFPEAEVKIFLTARPEIRGKRRFLELKAKKPDADLCLEEIVSSLEQRDEQDSSREVAPLKCPHDALMLDTSDYSIDQVVEMLLQHTLTKKK